MANRRITPHRFSSDLRLTYALPWYVHVPQKLRHIVGKSRAKFASKKAASSFAKDLEKKRAMIEHRRQLAAISREFEGCRDFKLVTEAATEVKRQEMPVLTLTDAFAQVVASKKQSGKRSNSVSTLACALKSFAKACQKPAGEVVAADIETWLYAGDYTPQTRKGRHTALSTAFNWLVKRKMVAGNPVAAVDAPAVAFKSVQILSVKNIRLLFETCHASDPALLPFLSLVLFGGLRVTEARRCKAENLINGVIDLAGESCKLNERRCIKISKQLEAWLAVSPFSSVEVPKFFKRMVALRKASGVAIPQNALRHSFCSYHLPIFGADATARAANNSPQMIYKHYAAMVTDEDAKEFANILPEKACEKSVALRPSTINLTPTP